MKKLYMLAAILCSLLLANASAQDGKENSPSMTEAERVTQQGPPSALAAYMKWREQSLPKYNERELTPHYAISLVATRLDANTAQLDVLIAAEMKHYVLTIQPVSYRRQANGEVLTTAVGRPIVIDQKAGRKYSTAADRIRIGDTTTQVPLGRGVEALQVTWSPKNDTREDPSNTTLVRLARDPVVIVNGYITGEAVR